MLQQSRMQSFSIIFILNEICFDLIFNVFFAFTKKKINLSYICVVGRVTN